MSESIEDNHLYIYLTELSYCGVVVFGKVISNMPEMQAVCAEIDNHTITCMTYTPDLDLDYISKKLGDEHGHLELCAMSRSNRNNSTNIMKCIWKCSDDTLGDHIIMIYMGCWPLPILSVNQSIHIEHGECRSSYCLRDNTGRKVLIIFDPGVIFALENMHIIMVGNDREIPQSLASKYTSTVITSMASMPRMLDTYLDIYYSNQVRYLLNMLTEGGLLLMPKVAKSIRSCNQVHHGSCIFDRMTMYTCLDPDSIMNLLRKAENIESLLLESIELDKTITGSGSIGKFKWSFKGMGKTRLLRNTTKGSWYDVVCTHCCDDQQWIKVTIRPINELLSVVLPKGCY